MQGRNFNEGFDRLDARYPRIEPPDRDRGLNKPSAVI